MEKFSEIQYIRPDLEAYSAALTAHRQRLAEAESWDAFKAEWMRMANEKRDVLTMHNIASVRNRVNMLDPFYDEEMKWLNRNYPAVQVKEKQTESVVLDSPYLEDFEKEFGTILVQTIRNNRLFANEALIPLQVAEAELAHRYSNAASKAHAQLNGQDMNLYGILKVMQSTDRAQRRQAFEAWCALHESVADELEEIYEAQIDVHVRMAKTLGFDSYIDLIYLQRRRFDYTAADAAAFRQSILENVTPVVQKLFEQQRQRLGLDRLHWYDEALVFPDGNVDPEGTTAELVQKAQEMYRELSPETAEYFDYVVKYELYDLDSKIGKRPGGFCSTLPALKSPFVFANFNGTAADVEVLTHEAGHGFEDYTASRIVPLMELARSTSEVNEIHSMTMEHFTYPWMEKFFGRETGKYLYQHLWGALNVLPYMCCVDEFQHRVYENPRMPRIERRGVWREIERKYMPWRDYDGNAFLESGAFWLKQQHIFLFPFYYIDYALAQTCAIQLFIRSLDDREAAWQDYLRLCRAGGSKGYFALLETAHLANPFVPGTLKDVIQRVAEQLEVFRREAEGSTNE